MMMMMMMIIEDREGGGVTIPFPTRNFSKIPVGFLLKIPVEVINLIQVR